MIYDNIVKTGKFVSMGYGDVGLDCGIHVGDDDHIFGVIGMVKQPKREIGSMVTRANKELIIEDYPVFLSFGKIESVDAMIVALQNVKNMMIWESK